MIGSLSFCVSAWLFSECASFTVRHPIQGIKRDPKLTSVFPGCPPSRNGNPPASWSQPNPWLILIGLTQVTWLSLNALTVAEGRDVPSTNQFRVIVESKVCGGGGQAKRVPPEAEPIFITPRHLDWPKQLGFKAQAHRDRLCDVGKPACLLWKSVSPPTKRETWGAVIGSSKHEAARCLERSGTWRGHGLPPASVP